MRKIRASEIGEGQRGVRQESERTMSSDEMDIWDDGDDNIVVETGQIVLIN